MRSFYDEPRTGSALIRDPLADDLVGSFSRHGKARESSMSGWAAAASEIHRGASRQSRFGGGSGVRSDRNSSRTPTPRGARSVSHQKEADTKVEEHIKTGDRTDRSRRGGPTTAEGAIRGVSFRGIHTLDAIRRTVGAAQAWLLAAVGGLSPQSLNASPRQPVAGDR